jgi:putative ABC transport system ATP-binding protein
MAGVHKRHGDGEQAVAALRGVDLELRAGEVVVLLGPSGSGKSTLLNVAAGIAPVDAGSVVVAGADLAALGPDGRAEHRSRHIGLVFQFFNLIGTLSAVDNVAVPLVIAREKAVRERARAALAEVGLADKADRRPHELSGGEMQRVAIARALVSNPSLLLADEPTGNLDGANGAAVLETIIHAVRSRGTAVLMVTHNEDHASLAHRSLHLHEGTLRG